MFRFLLYTRREIFFESCSIKLVSDCIYNSWITNTNRLINWLIWNQTEFRLVPKQSENAKYNLIYVWFNKSKNIFVCVHGSWWADFCSNLMCFTHQFWCVFLHCNKITYQTWLFKSSYCYSSELPRFWEYFDGDSLPSVSRYSRNGVRFRVCTRLVSERVYFGWEFFAV